MSIIYCHYCDKHIDTDFKAEHFECEGVYRCTIEEQDVEGTKEKCVKCKRYKVEEGIVCEECMDETMRGFT